MYGLTGVVPGKANEDGVRVGLVDHPRKLLLAFLQRGHLPRKQNITQETRGSEKGNEKQGSQVMRRRGIQLLYNINSAVQYYLIEQYSTVHVSQTTFFCPPCERIHCLGLYQARYLTARRIDISANWLPSSWLEARRDGYVRTSKA